VKRGKIGIVTRRDSIGLLFAAGLGAASETPTSLRGELKPGEKPVLAMPDGRRIALSGDAPTMHVLHDKRLAGADFEVVGKFLGPAQFQVGPIYQKSMFVHKDGKALLISYWCDVCSIRTYTPGICMCCQEETALDLKESFDQN